MRRTKIKQSIKLNGGDWAVFMGRLVLPLVDVPRNSSAEELLVL